MTVQDVVRQAIAGTPGPPIERFGEVPLSADNCLKCNVCNTACPVSRVTDLFPGPKYVGPQAQRFRLATVAPVQGGVVEPHSPDRTVDWCSGCGWCTTVCPADVKIAEINSRARAGIVADRGGKVRDWLLGQTDLIGRVGTPVAPLANWTLRNRPIRWLIEKIVGIHRKAPLPMYVSGTLQSRARAAGLPGTRRRGRAAAPEPPPDRAVVLFHGCAANYYEQHVAEAAIDVLRRNGFQTIVPPQVCCGLPKISNGRYEGARAQARSNLPTLAGYARRGYRIVGTSTSCTHTLKAEYREMLDLDDADARAVADATWDICEFLLELHDEGRLNTAFGRIDERLPYHAPCQLRSHGIGLPAMDLFALIPGLEAVDLDYDCCGVAGTYGLKKEKYEIAMAVGEGLFEKIRDSGATRAACDSETCRWQIELATATPTRHPIEIIAAAYAAGDGAA